MHIIINFKLRNIAVAHRSAAQNNFDDNAAKNNRAAKR